LQTIGTTAAPLVYEPTFQSSNEGRMYANISVEIVFGISKFLEAFMDKILGRSINTTTHPPATWRQELFVYVISNCSPNLGRFICEEYASGLLARLTMDSILKQFIAKMNDLARQRG
jgi:hypothetical protein